MSTAMDQVLAYHQRTKHQLQRYAAGPDTLDWDAQPNPFREWPGAPLVRLPLLAEGLTTTWAQMNDRQHQLGVVLGTSTDQTLTRLSPNASIQRFQTTGELLAAWQANRVRAAFMTAPGSDLAIARLRSGKTLIPRPVVAVPAGAGVRKENDTRWANYLSTCVAYYYNAGITQGFYDEFMAFRGLEAGRATAIQREAW